MYTSQLVLLYKVDNGEQTTTPLDQRSYNSEPAIVHFKFMLTG